MSSVVSSIIGANAQQNVAQTQANQSNYAVNTGALENTQNLSQQSEEFGKTLTEEQSEFGQQQGLAEKEYGQTQDTANDELANSAAIVGNAVDTPSPELAQEQADIEAQGTRSMADTSKQAGANNAIAGVRGGQAATLQNRAVGDVGIQEQSNIDELLAQDAAQRLAATTGYGTALATGAMAKVGAS